MNESSFNVYAGATTDDGFEFFVSKTVAFQANIATLNPKTVSATYARQHFPSIAEEQQPARISGFANIAAKNTAN
ncbi:MAG: hypothetical protein V8S08_06305 [Lachnoclostridium sp.]